MISAFEKLKRSLVKTKESILGNISRMVGGRRIDNDLLEEIEEILLQGDVGVSATRRLIENLKTTAQERSLTKGEEIVCLLQDEIAAILSSAANQAMAANEKRPVVWLIVGVNGGGKTTTIGKLATHFSKDGKKVVIGACDTFRAAAIDQISIWAERSSVDIVKATEGADPASVAFDAARAAAARGADILLLDTAGRLHTKSHLMEELKKMKRVVAKALPDTPVHSKLIIDGSTGQNAMAQAKLFTEAVECDGVIVTKLDGTAKGGVIIGIAEDLGLPVEFIGIGEEVDDLQPFSPQQFAQALFE
ncbi:MAG: signal recognition particle-docking protein FtsY [Candidatus Zixiibacteriota bacterium]